VQKEFIAKKLRPLYKKYAEDNGKDVEAWVKKKVDLLYQNISRRKKVSQVVDVVGNEQLLDQYFPFDFRWSCMYRLDKEGLNIFCELLKDHVEKKKNQASGIKQI
jgi:hypothetical protein